MKSPSLKQNIDSQASWQRFTAKSILPSRSSVLRLMGVPADKREGMREVDEPFAQAIELFEAKAQPRGGFRICEPKEIAPKLFVGCENSPLYERLLQAGSCALFLVTVGQGPEDEAVDRLAKGEYLLGTLLDTLASEAAERVVDRVQERVISELGIKKAVRFSPGYGGWSLEAQPILLSSMEATGQNIKLTEALMMLPKKSVSGVIIPQLNSKENTPCEHCELSECPKQSCWDNES